MDHDFHQTVQSAKADWATLQSGLKPLIMVGTATCGRSAGALAVVEAFRQQAQERGLELSVVEVGCIGLCYAEPIVCITMAGRPGICYGNVNPEKVETLVESWLLGDDPVAEYALGTFGEGMIENIPRLYETDVLRLQVRRALTRCGFIDPRSIAHYFANDGYEGLIRALDMTPEQVIDEVRRSGLRGRGGAGFPTWRKWQFCRDAPGDVKYLICNADEGDPGAFMNRSLIEGDPHSLLEGMIIAGYALGAHQSYIYCRAEYPLALERLREAIDQAEEHGLIGEDILGSGFDFKIKIKEGAGAFVCGEETALIASIQGERGMPRPRPPFPAVSGLWGRPTIINNVESLACVSHILRNGAAWFAEYGTEQSKGTKTIALVGKVKRSGLVEIPLGITLREMIYDIGGGTNTGKRFKGVQTGGPSGGCIPASLIDTPVDYDSLNAAGSIMGSGGMVVMDEDTCMVDFARYFLDFAEKESCGKCVPCRLGTKQMLAILQDITAGHGKPEDLDLLEELAQSVKSGSLCGLGQTAPNPVLTTIRYFRDEYEAHIEQKRCPAIACQELISSPCQHACPLGQEASTYIALVAQGRIKEAFDIIIKDNPLPSVCGRVCHHPCEVHCQAGKWDSPIAIREIKRFVADYAFEAGFYPTATERKNSGPKVAIIGSGPAGLTAGFYLGQGGYDVTIFEALDVPGGALVACIPEYRLPRERLAADLEIIRSVGVNIQTSTRIGKDIAFDEILDDFEAVYIASGAHLSHRLNIENEDADGVMNSMEFLKKMNLEGSVQLGTRVGIIGGGNSAIDAARVAHRNEDCEQVVVIYRRTRREMPALEEEVDALFEEGIGIQFLTSPTRVIVENGRVAGVECVRMELGAMDESGRRRPIPVEGSEFVIDLDTLIIAVGEGPDVGFLDEQDGIEISKWGSVETDPETFATNVAGVFAGGDAVTGPSTVVEAMSSGKIAARMIDKYLKGESVRREYKLTRPSMYVPPIELTEQEVAEAARLTIPSLHASERKNNFDEVVRTISEDVAIKEAKRCLRCEFKTQDGERAMAAIMGGGGAD